MKNPMLREWCARCRLTPPVCELSRQASVHFLPLSLRRIEESRPVVLVIRRQHRTYTLLKGTSHIHLAVSESWFAGCSLCYCDRRRDTNNVISECEIPTNFWHSSSERGRYQHNASIVIERQRTVGFKGTGALHQHEFEEGKTQQRRIVVDFIQLRRRS